MKAAPTPVRRHLTVGLAVAATLTLAACSSTNASSGDKTSTEADIAVGKVGTMDQFADISSVCGDKPVKVGIVDGFGTNSWSKTVKAEIESEAA